MSLLTLPAFRFRRRETAMPETATPTKTEPNVLMRFLTQGGAEVRVTVHGRFERTSFSGHTYGVTAHHWTCLGCTDGSDHYDRLDESDARTKANAHAEKCRAMPKPEA